MEATYRFDPELIKRAREGKGFIAALDQSGGSTPKALANYGVPEGAYTENGVRDAKKMFDLVHAMRTRVMTSPSFTSERILGAILFEQTMDREVEGQPTPSYLKSKGILPFLKIDKGLLPAEHGVRLMKDIPDLDELLEVAAAKGIFGTKMRSVIDSFDEEGIVKIVDQQFELAGRIMAHGLVPIIEPETTVSSFDRISSEHLLHHLIFEHVLRLPESARIMLKISIPVDPTLYEDLLDDPRVVRIVALSGGYPREEACGLLKKCPGMIASFSRALLEGLSASQDEEAFEKSLSSSIDLIYDASINKEEC